MAILLHPGILLLLSSIFLYILQYHRLVFKVLSVSLPLLYSIMLFYTSPSSQNFGYLFQLSIEYTDHNIAICKYILVCTSIINLSLWPHNSRGYYNTTILSTAYVAVSLISLLSADFTTMIYTFEVVSIISAIMLYDRYDILRAKLFYQYLIMHCCSNMLILAGTMIIKEYHGIEIINLTQFFLSDDSGHLHLASAMVLSGLLLKTGLPILTYSLIVDSYSISGIIVGIYLSILNSALHILWISRLFLGLNILIFAGVIITIFSTIHAIIEDRIKNAFIHLFVAKSGMLLILIGISKNHYEITNAITAICITYILLQPFTMIICYWLQKKYDVLKFSDFDRIKTTDLSLVRSICFAFFMTVTISNCTSALIREYFVVEYHEFNLLFLLCNSIAAAEISVMSWQKLYNRKIFLISRSDSSLKNKLNLLEHSIIICFVVIGIFASITCCTTLSYLYLLPQIIVIFMGVIIYYIMPLHKITAGVIHIEDIIYIQSRKAINWLYNKLGSFWEFYIYQKKYNLLKEEYHNYINSLLVQHNLSIANTILLLIILLTISVI